jgi:hypothetical protein
MWFSGLLPYLYYFAKRDGPALYDRPRAAVTSSTRQSYATFFLRSRFLAQPVSCAIVFLRNRYLARPLLLGPYFK